MSRVPKVFGKTYATPRNPYEKERLDQELKIIGVYGLRNKREVWRVKFVMAKICKCARELLTLDEKDPRRLFGGNGTYRFYCLRFCVIEAVSSLWNLTGG